jgi:putative endonuclease
MDEFVCDAVSCYLLLSGTYFDMKGSEAERYAEMFLLQRQLVLLQRNYRCRFGEIDLVMLDKETLVFIEVRLRGNSAFGGAAASITPFKQAKLLRAARHYLAGLRTVPPCRFDAILLTGSNGEEV